MLFGASDHRVLLPLKKAVIFVHRWVGVALCLLFLLWFASGIGMMHWDYPNVTAADRLRHEPPLDPGKITFAGLGPLGLVERCRWMGGR